VRNRRPARGLGGDEGGKILRRADFRFRAQPRKACLRVLGSKDLVDRDVKLLDDGGGRSRRRQQPRPERGEELGVSALGRGRHARQQRRARLGRARNRPPWTWGRRMAVVSQIICTWPPPRPATDL